jgi:pseudouridine synthase
MGVASRRECEQMILDGRVEVNGRLVAELPAFVDPREDRITVDGRPLRVEPRRASRVYVMLNKPDNTLGTTKDELAYEKGGRRTVTDLVEHPSGARLYPVGRLDYHTTGLVVMTNDGELAQRLTHASFGITKTYRVWLGEPPTPEQLAVLRRRVGKRGAVDEAGAETGGVRVVEPPRRRNEIAQPSSVIEVEVREGRTDPLEDVLVQAGCRVKRIARTGIGPLRLIGVKPGEWRDLTKDEVRTLMDATGLGRPAPGRRPRKERSRPEEGAGGPEGSGASGGPGGGEEAGG